MRIGVKKIEVLAGRYKRPLLSCQNLGQEVVMQEQDVIKSLSVKCST